MQICLADYADPHDIDLDEEHLVPPVWHKITSKYDSDCKCCGGSIWKEDDCWWQYEWGVICDLCHQDNAYEILGKSSDR